MNLKEYQKFKIDNGITDRDIAKTIGCSLATLSCRKKKKNFSLVDINLLVKKYKMTTDDIIKIFFNALFTFC